MSNPVMTKAKLNTVMKNIVKIVNEQGPNERAILDAIFKKYPGSEVTDGETIIEGKELVNIAFNLPFSYKPTMKELEKFSNFDGIVKNLENINIPFLTVFLAINDEGKVILESEFYVEAYYEWSEEDVTFSLDLGLKDEFVVDIKEGDNKVSILEQQGYKQVGEKVDRVVYQKEIRDIISQISIFKEADLVEAEFFTKANKVQFRPAVRKFSKSEGDIQALVAMAEAYKDKPLKVMLKYLKAELVHDQVEETYRVSLIGKVQNQEAVEAYLESVAIKVEQRLSKFYHFATLQDVHNANDNIPNVDVVNQVNTEVTPDDQVGEDVLDNIQVSDLVGLEELRNMYIQNGYTIVIANQANIRGFYGDANLNIGVSVTSDNGDDSGETVDVYVNVSGVSKRKDQLIDYLQDKGFDEEGWREFNDLKFNLRELNNQLKLYKGVVDQFNKKADEFDQLKKEERKANKEAKKANKEARKNEPKQEKSKVLTDEEKAYLGASVEQLKMELRELGVANPKGVKLALIRQLIELKQGGNPGEMNTIDLIKNGLTKQGFKIDDNGNQFRAELKVGQATVIVSTYKQGIYAIVEGPKGIDVTRGTIGIIKNSGLTLIRNNKREGARFELDFEGAGKQDVDNFIDKIINCAKDINEDVAENNFEVIKEDPNSQLKIRRTPSGTIQVISIGATGDIIKNHGNYDNMAQAELKYQEVLDSFARVAAKNNRTSAQVFLDKYKTWGANHNIKVIKDDGDNIELEINGRRVQYDMLNGEGTVEGSDEIVFSEKAIAKLINTLDSKGDVKMITHDITIDRDELEGDLIIRSKALGVAKHVNDEDLLQEMDKLDKLAAKKNIKLNWVDLRKNAAKVDPWEDAKKQEKSKELTDEEKAYLGASIEQLKMELRELGVENPKGVKLALIKQLIGLKQGGNPGEMNTVDMLEKALNDKGFSVSRVDTNIRAEGKLNGVNVLVNTSKKGYYAVITRLKVNLDMDMIRKFDDVNLKIKVNSDSEGFRAELDFNGAGQNAVLDFVNKLEKVTSIIPIIENTGNRRVDANFILMENNIAVKQLKDMGFSIFDTSYDCTQLVLNKDNMKCTVEIYGDKPGIDMDGDEYGEDQFMRVSFKGTNAPQGFKIKNVKDGVKKLNLLLTQEDVFGTSDPWEDVKKQEELKIVNNLVQEYRDKIAHRPNVKTNTLLDKDTKFLPGFSVKVNGFEQFDVLIEEQNKKFKATIQPAGDFMSLQGKVQKLVQELKQKGFDAKESGTGVAVFGSYNKNDLSIVHDLSKLIDVVSTIKLDAIEPKVDNVKKQDIDLENLNNLKVAELKQILKDLGITSPQGVKASLVQQIKDIKGNGTKGAEKTPEPAPKAQDEKPQVQPKAVAEEPAPKVETTAKLSMVSDSSMKEQLKKLQTIARKWEDDINADPDINLFFLEEPKEFKKYNLPTVALGFVCYDLKLSKQELNQDPVFKRFKKGRGLVGLGDWFTTVAPDGRKCKMCLFLDKDFEKASDENRKTVSRLYRKFKMSESVGTEIEYNGGTFLLESVGNSYARFSKDKKTYLVNLDDLED